MKPLEKEIELKRLVGQSQQQRKKRNDNKQNEKRNRQRDADPLLFYPPVYAIMNRLERDIENDREKKRPQKKPEDIQDVACYGQKQRKKHQPDTPVSADRANGRLVDLGRILS